MDAFKKQMKQVACGGYGWHWSGEWGLSRRLKKQIHNGVRRTARRKMKQKQDE